MTREALRKMSCHISEKTAHLYTALEVNLDETVEKNVGGRASGREPCPRLAMPSPGHALA